MGKGRSHTSTKLFFIMVLVSAAKAVPHTSCVIEGIIYYGSDNQLLCWKEGNPLPVANLDDHIEAVCQADANKILVGTANGTLYLVDFITGKAEILDELSRPVTCVASNSESLFVAGCMDGSVYIYKALTHEKTAKKTKGFALCAAFCEELLVLGGTASNLLVIHLPTGAEKWVEGHEGWVRSLSFRKESPACYTLASGSQERYIRLWTFKRQGPTFEDEILLNNATVVEDWNITFEALLMGHDDWVVGVSWDPSGSKTLLSASADSSLILWMAESSDLWTPDHRLGDISNWGASTATGTTGGFWAALWLADSDGSGSSVATVTRTGSFRVWNKDSGGMWQPENGPTGHFKEVTDVSWFHNEFLLTTSLDQTTRLWHYSRNLASLVEIGRPQIHGYDMIAISPIDSKSFVSAGDEKVMRVFELPRQVAEQMMQITKKSSEVDSIDELPLIAGIPALGLSNKPDSEENSLEVLPHAPREDHLQRMTLWPEVDKLYGHGYEINCLAVSRQLGTIVSASRANTEQHARLKFFSTTNYHEITKHFDNAPSHSLTVSKLAVSPNGNRVISVSRDRKFMITNIETQVVEVEFPKAHTRIIWDAAWCSNNEEFFTASRDKQIKKWRSVERNIELLKAAKFDSPVTAVAAGSVCVAVGEESGRITLWDLDLTIQHKEFRSPHRVNRIAMNENSLAAVSGHTLQVFEL